MLQIILWSMARHHGEAADPDLLEWIKDRLDHLLGLGPWTVVAVVGLLVLLIPISVVVLYLVQRRQFGVVPNRSNGDDS